MVLSEFTKKVLYPVVGFLLLIAALGRGAINKTWRKSVPERLGFGRWSQFQKTGGAQVVWIHAASVGEVIGIRSLFQVLKEQYPAVRLLITTTSLTGRDAALGLGVTSDVFLLPLDSPIILKPVLEAVHPTLFIITETELWPNLLVLLKQKSVPVLLINGRISQFSLPQYMRFRWFFRPALEAFSQVLAQTERDKARFESIGVQSDRVLVTGSTKYDSGVLPPKMKDAIDIRVEHQIPETSLVIVLGSVREGEDEQVIRALSSIQTQFRNLVFILAPRHPERFQAVAELLEKYKIRFVRRSAGSSCGENGVMLLDTLGELNTLYGIADVVFVGGTLTNVGGHNPFEPALQKRGVIVGPFTSNYHDAVRQLLEGGGAKQVANDVEFLEVVGGLLRSRQEREQFGENAYRVALANQGATKRVITQVAKFLINEV